MANARTRFDTIADFMQREHGAALTTLYRQPAVQIGTTPFLFYLLPGIAFRLRGRVRDQALRLSGTKAWGPRGAAAASSPWVLVPVDHFLRWDRLAIEALRQAEEGQPARPAARPTAGPPAPPPAASRWSGGIGELLKRAAALRLLR